MTTTADTSVATVRRFMNAVGTGQLDEARGLLSEDAVIDEAGGMPFSGVYRGPQGFVDLLTRMSTLLELVPEPFNERALTDDTVVCRYRAMFTSRQSGKTAAMGLVEVFTVKDGRIVEIDVYYKDPSAIASLLDH
jgi:uncharacterized protein